MKTEISIAVNHKTHLSYNPVNGWIVMHQGSPLCDYKRTRAEAERAAAHYRLKLPNVTYTDFRWVETSTIVN